MKSRYTTIGSLAACFLLAFGIHYSLSSSNGVDSSKLDIKDVDGWRITDFKPYVKAIDDLKNLSEENSNAILSQAFNEYSIGIDILEDADKKVRELLITNKTKNKHKDRYPWEEIDRMNGERRQVAAIKAEAKMKATTYFTRAIDHLDQVLSEKVRNDRKFTETQKLLFKVYVSTQYDLQNFKPCIPILERYVAIAEKDFKDIEDKTAGGTAVPAEEKDRNDKQKVDLMWAHRYLSSCYSYMENVMHKYRYGNEDEIMQYRTKKNKSLLKSVRLQYGSESDEYKHITNMVEQDERKSIRVNDFK